MVIDDEATDPAQRRFPLVIDTRQGTLRRVNSINFRTIVTSNSTQRQIAARSLTGLRQLAQPCNCGAIVKFPALVL